MLKILGIAILLFSGGGIAVFLSKEEDIKLLRTRAWIEMMIFVRSSVDSYAMTASEILASCDRELLLRLGYPITDDAPQSLSGLFESVGVPDRESGEALRSFFGDFGKNYREYQVSRCDDCIRRLREREAELSNGIAAKKKVIFAISLCAAAAVVILLL